jgi:hypothetical protein
LADLDHWDPNSIHGVFKAAIDRANGVRSTATQIGDVMATTPWRATGTTPRCRPPGGSTLI